MVHACEQGDRQVWADSAYHSEQATKKLKASGYKPRINHKGSRAKSWSGRPKQVSRGYSKVRARVEHGFGTMSNEMEQNHHQASGTELFSETTLPSSGETLQVFLKETHTDAIMIAHKSSVVANWYAPHFDPINTHILFSVSKSITVTVAGILQHQGLLDPASPVSDYLPIPAESAYSDCTVQHLLDMTVALEFEETYAAGAQDFRRYRNASGWDPVDDGSTLEGLRQFIFGLGKLDDQHGRIFRYRSPN